MVENPDLLYCGTEFSIFRLAQSRRIVTRINNNLPTVDAENRTVIPRLARSRGHARAAGISDVHGRQVVVDARPRFRRD